MEYSVHEKLANEITDASVLEIVKRSNERLNGNLVHKVLLIYDESEFFLGDNCILLYRLGLLRHCFDRDIEMDINFTNTADAERYTGIAKNNPNYSNVFISDLESIVLIGYNLVIVISPDESLFLKKIKSLYNGALFGFFIMSLSSIVFARRINRRPSLFPDFVKIIPHLESIRGSVYELYISDAERHWADGWLKDRGVKQGEPLFVVIDNASHHTKMINRKTYREVLLHLLSISGSKILIFDEKGVGKKEFYLRWMGEEYAGQFLFSEKMSLRDDICLLSSHFTRLIFGPCTGLLHCASGVFNNLARRGSEASPPLILTYTGPWDAHFWWGRSPLVDCLVLRNTNGNKKMAALGDLAIDERGLFEERLVCNEYTSDMLIEYIDKRLS